MANNKIHRYQTQVLWTGNLGQGTASYRAYERSHEIIVEGKPLISGSSDPAFRGDRTKYNPEELLVTSISSCHIVLKPVVTIALSSDKKQAEKLHEQAHHLCFVANSMNFPVLCESSILIDNVV